MNSTIQSLAIGIAFTLLGAVSPAMAAPKQTGVQGQAFLYISFGAPIELQPGVWAGIPSVQLPVATAFTVVSSHNGREVGRVTTDAQGLYSVSLAPGKYVLIPDPLNLNPFFPCESSSIAVEVTVRAKQMTTANVFYYREGPCLVR